MSVLPEYICVYHAGTWCLWKSEEGIGSSGTRVTDGYKLLCRCWDSYLGPLHKQDLFCPETSILKYNFSIPPPMEGILEFSFGQITKLRFNTWFNIKM